MATDFVFERDDAGIEDVLEQPGMAKFINNAAGNIARAIETRGPTRRSSFFDYRQNIGVMPAVVTREGMVGAVVVDTPGWHLPEYGTSRVSATAPIRRGARDVRGVKFEES